MLSVRRYAANFLTGLLPKTRCYRLKSAIWRAAGVDICSTARLVSSVRIWTSGPVTIGSDAFLGHEVLIVGGDAPVRIGASCDLAPRVLLVTGTHLDGGAERAAGPGLSLPISIGTGAWIGAATTVLGGVSIGKGTVIGAGSLVKKSIPAQVIAVGVPCAMIKDRI
jgi:acetyltransferase-like isoleucine patch superfamily enzyme